MKIVKLIFFILLIPGAVGVLIPSLFLPYFPQTFDIGLFRLVSVPIFIFGLFVFSWSVVSFFFENGATPAIFFSKQLSFLIGEEPAKLVSSGFYKYSRNPMYVGVISIVLALGLFYQTYALIIYAIFLLLFFTFVIVFFEEPHLKNKYGNEYVKYLKSTPRWIGYRKQQSIHRRKNTAANKSYT